MKPPLHHPSVRIARARIENAAADTGQPVRIGPPRSRSHTSEGGSLASVAPWKPSPLADRIRPIAKAAPTPATIRDSAPGRGLTSEEEKTIFLSYSPPRFHIPKKGPNAGQPVEQKRRISIVTRCVSDSYGNEYKFTSRSSKVTLTPIHGQPLKLSPAQVRRTFALRFPPMRAPFLSSFLLMEA